MPIFDFKCSKCQNMFEAITKTASGKPKCPKCGSKSVKKLPSLFAAAKAKNQSHCQCACEGNRSNSEHCNCCSCRNHYNV